MEEDQGETASTLSMEGAVLDDDVGASDDSAAAKPTLEAQEATSAAPSNQVQKVKVVVATEEQFQSVFSNSLITDKILSYMNFEEIKACREVSRVFLEMIESYSRFKDAQVLIITKECPFLKNDFNFALDSHPAIWRGIRIDVNELRDQTWRIPNAILHNVQFVSFVSSEYISTEFSEKIVTDILSVLDSTPKISHLQLPVHVFEFDLSDVFRCNDVQENLKDLKCLDILEFLGWNWTARYNTKNLLANVDELASILQRLQSLHIPKGEFREDQKRELQTGIMKLIHRNRETLRELFVHLDFWEQMEICDVKLPRLKLLTGTVRKTDQDTLTDFLVNHADTLEEVDVAVRKQFGKSLFDVIKQRCCPKLIKLRLKSKKFVDSVGGREEFIDWTFLGTMTRLKDFQLSRPKCNNANWQAYGNGSRLLECLPRNQLQRLGFRGIGWRTCGFWRNNHLEDEPELSIKLDLLCGFLNLRRLSLPYCPDAVDDDVMRFIVTEMTTLEVLEVSHCSKLTNSGISGALEDGSDSIRNLKRLKELRILHCPLVTPEGILSSIQLPFLRRFAYLAQERVSLSFVRRLVSQNPSLESLAVNFTGQWSNVWDMLKARHPRISELIDLCNEASDQDSDSDADNSESEEESEAEENGPDEDESENEDPDDPDFFNGD